jgi:hypothetical protein
VKDKGWLALAVVSGAASALLLGAAAMAGPEAAPSLVPDQSGIVAGPEWTPPDGGPIDIFPEEACVGTVVNGVCHGSLVPTRPPLKCWGQVLNGKCTGPVTR